MSYQVLIPKVMTEVGRQYLLDHDCIPVEREDATVETLCRQVVGADALLVRTEPCPRSVFEAADRLKVVAKYGAGVDNIDLEAATEHGGRYATRLRPIPILWRNTQSCCCWPVPKTC